MSGQLLPYSEGTRAILTVHFLSDTNEWIPINIMFDSGSDVTVLPYEFAIKLRWYGPQIPLLAREVVGSVAMLKTDVMVALMGKVVRVPMITSAFILDPLLGMSDINSNFIITLAPQGFSIIPT